MDGATFEVKKGGNGATDDVEESKQQLIQRIDDNSAANLETN